MEYLNSMPCNMTSHLQWCHLSLTSAKFPQRLWLAVVAARPLPALAAGLLAPNPRIVEIHTLRYLPGTWATPF